MIGPHDHHRRTDTVSQKLLRWLSGTGQRGGSRTGCAVSEQTDNEEGEPDHPYIWWCASDPLQTYCEATSYGGQQQQKTLDPARASDTWHVPTALLSLVGCSIRHQVACTQCGTWSSSPTV